MAKSEDKIKVESYDIGYLKAVLSSHTAPKSVKEAALRQIREIENKTGETIYGEYNSDPLKGITCRNPSELQRMLEEAEGG